jgi:oligopeptide/dipeptide ABC transporter ATP-binding protein
MAALLEAKDLRITAPGGGGPVALVDGLDLQVDPGEAVALVGESGCGKSLTALALFRLLPEPLLLSAASLRLGGQDLLAMKEGDLCRVRGREMALVFQDPLSALDPVMTVGDQVAEAVTAHEKVSRSEARARALDALKKVGIPDPGRRLDAYPHQLSGGMRQRVLIATAIAPGPRLLVADEPTTALDVTVQAQILDLLDDLRRTSGLAVLLITHDLGVVARFAGRVAVMYAGRMVEQGPTSEVVRFPAHPYTRGLMDSVPRLGASRRRLAAIPGTVPPPDRRPPGCAFAPRCPLREPACEAGMPDLRDLGGGRRARCIRAGETP